MARKPHRRHLLVLFVGGLLTHSVPLLERVLVTGANRTRGSLRTGDDPMAAVTAEALRFVAQPVINGLT